MQQDAQLHTVCNGWQALDAVRAAIDRSLLPDA
jgi:hypothetical protein